LGVPALYEVFVVSSAPAENGLVALDSPTRALRIAIWKKYRSCGCAILATPKSTPDYGPHALIMSNSYNNVADAHEQTSPCASSSEPDSSYFMDKRRNPNEFMRT
jgi:hypothetical protein